MAQTIALVPGVVASAQICKFIEATVTLTADTYATASGGVQVDLNTILTNAGKAIGLNNGIPPALVVAVSGKTATGYRVDGTLTQTSNANDGKVNLRLWNGITEIGDGAITQTIGLTIRVAV